MSGDVGEAARCEVSVGRVVGFCGRWKVFGEVGVHGRGLVGGLGKVVAEPAGAVNPGDFGADGLGTTDGSDIRTRSGELRCELRCFLAIIGLAGCADPCSGRL